MQLHPCQWTRGALRLNGRLIQDAYQIPRSGRGRSGSRRLGVPPEPAPVWGVLSRYDVTCCLGIEVPASRSSWLPPSRSPIISCFFVRTTLYQAACCGEPKAPMYRHSLRVIADSSFERNRYRYFRLAGRSNGFIGLLRCHRILQDSELSRRFTSTQEGNW